MRQAFLFLTPSLSLQHSLRLPPKRKLGEVQKEGKKKEQVAAV